MGSILGGGNSGAKKAAREATTAANTAADQTILASQGAANSINQGSQVSSQGYLQGSQTAADAQQQALDYLRQADQLPTGLRENALRSLGDLYGANGGGGSITDRAMASPLYQAAVQQGENSVLRNASATGGLRSGSTSENLAQVNQNALIAAYNDQIAGLQGLSSLPSNANNIAGYMSGVGNTLGQGQISSANALGQGQITAGQTLAQGQMSAAQTRAQGATAAAQTQAQGAQNSANNTTALIGAGLTAAMMFSDRRLKDQIVFVGMENGIAKYKWIWNAIANSLGLHGSGYGVMADEVEQTNPDAVSVRDGYLFVDYHKLGVTHGV